MSNILSSQCIEKIPLEIDHDINPIIGNKVVPKSGNLSLASIYFDVDISAFSKLSSTLNEGIIHFKISKNKFKTDLFDVEIINDSIFKFQASIYNKVSFEFNKQHILNIACGNNLIENDSIKFLIKVNRLSKKNHSVNIVPLANFSLTSTQIDRYKLRYDAVFKKFIIHNLVDTVAYELSEPFIVQNKAYYFDSLDLSNRTICLFLYPDSLKLFGHKIGYYVNDVLMEKIKKFGNLQTELYVLYFWGSWCSPCLKNLSKIVSLERMLNVANSKIKFISIKVILNKDNREYHLPDYNANLKFSLEIEEFVGKFMLDKNRSFCKGLNCYFFPTAVLVAGNGKIMQRINNDYEKL
ncbi:MAG: hypothetical protein IPK61_10535 [Saprospiraceae bacterium]|nr:hypothetical protein [Saprospiraceae bacterium]MBK7794976.1 hypothetical protein [Saprospiraceae bacterium]MBK8153437.1 hypothetical protein [Saprospiraceae bacterium]